MADDLIPSSEVAPYTLPLSREEYTRALRLGLGRALLHAREYGIADFVAETADACINCYEHDAQLNGTRSDWMHAILRAAGSITAVTDHIVRTWSRSPGVQPNHWSDDQLCELLSLFAQDGHQESRAMLRRVFRKDMSMSLIGANEIIELDGPNGLRFVCEQMGTWLISDPALVLDDEPIKYFDEFNGNGKAIEVLKPLRKTSPSIGAYLDYLEAKGLPEVETISEYEEPDEESWEEEYNRRVEARRTELRSIPPEVIIESIQNDLPGWPRTRVWKWGLEASDSNLRTIADAVLREKDSTKLERYLWAYRHRPFTLVDARFVALAHHKDLRVREAFYCIAKNVKHELMRELAIQCVTNGEITEGQIELFILNGGPGDADLIAGSLHVPDNDWRLHMITTDLLSLCESNPTMEFAKLLRFVYEQTNCGFCRLRALDHLRNAGGVPSWIQAEAEHGYSKIVSDSLNKDNEDDS